MVHRFEYYWITKFVLQDYYALRREKKQLELAIAE